jgi:hypothetical protein
MASPDNRTASASAERSTPGRRTHACSASARVAWWAPPSRRTGTKYQHSAKRIENLRRPQTPEQDDQERRAAEQQNGPEHRKISSIIVPSYLSRGDGSLLARGQTQLEAEMRKQDRIAGSQQQSRPQQHPVKKEQPEPKEREQLKGGASPDQPAKPQRQPGKLPLPD